MDILQLFSCLRVSAESPSNISHNPSEVISEVSELYDGNGFPGGTGAVYKGKEQLSLCEMGSVYCAASAYATAIPPGADKTTTGSCSLRAGQWEDAEILGNPGELLGLATPSARPSAVSQGNTSSSEDSP